MNTFGRKAIFILEIWTWNNLAESWIVRLEHSNKEGWKYRLGRHCAINDRLYARIVSNNCPGRLDRMGREAGIGWKCG